MGQMERKSRVRDYEDTVASGDDLSASRTYGWVKTKGFKYARFQLDVGAVALTDGTFKLQGSAIGEEAAAFDLNTANVVVHGNGGSATVGASATELEMAVSELPDQLRLVYTRVAGGGSGQLHAHVTLHN